MSKFSTYLFLLIFIISCQSEEEADMVIKNGVIYTMNEAQPQVEAVAITDGKIIFAGPLTKVEKFIGEKTEVLDLEGKAMTPGLIESHAHFLGVGYNKLNLDLLHTTSYEEIVDMVAEAAKNAEPGEWIQGRGWHQSKWDSLPEKMVMGFQTHDLLSAVSPDNPVYLKHASGHAGFANAKAMEIAGIKNIDPEFSGTKEVEGGEIIRDELGNPTGIFNETAMRLITKHIPKNSVESHKKAIALASQECLENGITSFHDAGADSLDIAAFKAVVEEGNLKTRLYVMLSSGDTAQLKRWYQTGPLVGHGDHFLTIRSIKLYVDGALGSRGAWLLQEYEDRPNHFGHETTPMNFVEMVVNEGLANGFQVCSHAIGDRANREVLDTYEAAFKANPEKAGNHRFRIEHAQHLTEEDIPRFGQLGVIPAMQAIHMSSDRPWAIHRLGLARIQEGAYVWKKLLESGAVVINGTDAPVEPISPIASFYASVSRKTLKKEPEGGYEPSQRMSREEALRSYTLDAAYGAFEEDIKGSIEVGKLADFTVFSKDIMTVPEGEILDTEILYTILNGKVAYQK
ncbi:amidohydrolase [Flexithrix dorotheae]|uniref:amidohydrolase n=1 Tax=Flexithrix dorotheae TaxID=70993 RepID=UPI000378EDC2|nr:amidohydrolase [Flexithrix dorotheae]